MFSLKVFVEFVWTNFADETSGNNFAFESGRKSMSGEIVGLRTKAGTDVQMEAILDGETEVKLFSLTKIWEEYYA